MFVSASPLAGYCSRTVGAAMTKFSRIIRKVHLFAVLKFRARATNGASSARAQLRHCLNIGRPLLPENGMHIQQWAKKPHLKTVILLPEV